MKIPFIRYFRRKRPPTPVDILAGYAAWAKNYPPAAHNPLMMLEQEAMLGLLPDDLTGLVCLDLACGSGRYVLHLQQRRAGQLVGADYSPDMLAQAASYQSPVTNYRLTRAPFFPLPFANETFDLITCGLAVGHEQNLERLLAEAGRALRSGGALLYSDFHPFGTLAGWQRTFIHHGTTYSLQHYPHLYSRHQQACRQAGLTIEAIREPLLGEHGPPEYRHFPAVLVIKAVKG